MLERTRGRRPRWMAAVLPLLSSLACASGGLPQAPAPEVRGPTAAPTRTLAEGAETYRRALVEERRRREAERARLEADLRLAEQEIVALESRAPAIPHADSVSSLAQARVDIDRAARLAPWRAADVSAARELLAEAERQLENEHGRAAAFFSARARRLALSVATQAEDLEGTGDALHVVGSRVNLRAGPSRSHRVVAVLEAHTPVFPESEHPEWLLVRSATGHVGWVHRTLVE